MLREVNIFAKPVQYNGKTFISYSTKDKTGEYYRVKFSKKAEQFITDNKLEVKPYCYLIKANRMGDSTKNKKLDDGRIIEIKTLYVDEIEGVKEYERPEIDSDKF